MRHLEQQITTAQHRLWVNRWLADLARFTACAGLLFAVIVLVQRLYDAPIPLMWVAVGMGVLALVGSIACTAVRRENRSIAAAQLDQAAGLRERLSSGQYCLDSDDPFARAVVADAEGRATGLSARRHIRLRTPGMLPWAAGSFILAALMFLVSPGLLKRNEALADASSAEIQETKVAVKKQLKAVKKLVESIPALEDLRGKLDELDVPSDSKLMRPSELRHAAIKKMDALADAIKKKRESDEMQSSRAMRKMMRGLQTPTSTQSATRKLTEALKQGDFKKARKEIEALKQMLSTLKSEQDRKMAEQVGKQLEALSKQLEQLARNESLEKKLEQMGLTQANVKKLLKSASKEDLEKMAKKLSDKGMSQQQIQSIKNQVRQQQQSGPLAQKLAEALGKSASSAQAGKMGQSMAGLAMAGDQLSDIEMLDQQMSDLNSAMSQLQNAKDNLDKPGSKGQGSGSRAGRQGSGGGMGPKPGQGRGGLASESPSGVAFQTQRGKVHTGQGAIIGQFRVDGEQIKGDVTEEISELISASHRDATDRISRDRLPRQYHKAVKSYFATANEKFRKAASGKESSPEKKKAAQAKPDASEE